MHVPFRGVSRFLIAAFVLVSMRCDVRSPVADSRTGTVRFFTDRTLYASSDTLLVSLENDEQSPITVGLRCGTYLEMVYQRWNAQEWSESLNFPYRSLLCPTVLDTIGARKTMTISLGAHTFDSTGTFRLIANIQNQSQNGAVQVVSNPFNIQE